MMPQQKKGMEAAKCSQTDWAKYFPNINATVKKGRLSRVYSEKDWKNNFSRIGPFFVFFNKGLTEKSGSFRKKII